MDKHYYIDQKLEQPYTLQVGDPNIIATLTGLDVVADFRRKDIALGGQGTSLAPVFHKYIFRGKGLATLLLILVVSQILRV